MCFNNSFKSQPVMRQSLHLSLCIFYFFFVWSFLITHTCKSVLTQVWSFVCESVSAADTMQLQWLSVQLKAKSLSKEVNTSVIQFSCSKQGCHGVCFPLRHYCGKIKNTIILFSQYQQIIFKWQECCGHALHKITIIITYLSYYHMCLIDTISILKF